MRKLILLLFLIALYKPTSSAQDACAGLVAPRLVTGGRVMLDDGIGLVLHEESALNSNSLGNLAEGTLFIVIGSGATCADNQVWWQVRLADGREGFLAEGGTSRYYAEPYEIGAHIFQEDTANNLMSHVFVDATGESHLRTPFPLTPRTGTAFDLWQSPELELANQVLQERRAVCPDVLPLEMAFDISSVAFTDNQRHFYPSPDGQKMLVFRDYTLGLPDCANSLNEQFGTTYVSLVDVNGEQVIFPYSQHSNPPASEFCQTPLVFASETRTFVDEVKWSPDGKFAALGMRYLRNSQHFPCAFYHIFLVNLQTFEVSYLDAGRRVSWADDGRRLQFVRHERLDPNQIGIERMFSVRPDRTDKIEIYLPDGMRLIPDSLDLLPHTTQGNEFLVCVGDGCEQVSIFSLNTLAFSSPMPSENDFLSVYFVAGGTKLLWLNSQGQVFIQSDERQALALGLPIVEVIPIEDGFGAVLRTPENRYFYWDVTSNEVNEVSL